MTPEEQTLIQSLFDRLRQADGKSKDLQADQLIQQKINEVPSATYLLTQMALVQQHALANAQAKIAQLEDQLRGGAGGTGGSGGSGGGGFLGSSGYSGGYQTPPSNMPRNSPPPNPGQNYNPPNYPPGQQNQYSGVPYQGNPPNYQAPPQNQAPPPSTPPNVTIINQTPPPAQSTVVVEPTYGSGFLGTALATGLIVAGIEDLLAFSHPFRPFYGGPFYGGMYPPGGFYGGMGYYPEPSPFLGAGAEMMGQPGYAGFGPENYRDDHTEVVNNNYYYGNNEGGQPPPLNQDFNQPNFETSQSEAGSFDQANDGSGFQQDDQNFDDSQSFSDGGFDQGDFDSGGGDSGGGSSDDGGW